MAVNEKDARDTNSQKMVTSKKFRVVVAREKLLKQAYEMDYRHQTPNYLQSYMRKRWETVVNMSRILADKQLHNRKWNNTP